MKTKAEYRKLREDAANKMLAARVALERLSAALYSAGYQEAAEEIEGIEIGLSEHEIGKVRPLPS